MTAIIPAARSRILCLIVFLFLIAGPARQGRAQTPAPPIPYPKPRFSGASIPPLPERELQLQQLQSPSAPTGMDAWSKIVYQSFRDGQWEIYLAQGDGSAPINLSRHPAADASPHLNRGATHVVFSSDRDGNAEIYSMRADGGGLARLTDHPADDYAPKWSPAGDRVVFVSERDGNPEIYVVNADGSGTVRLTDDAAADHSPVWSPDSSRIAWVRADEYFGSIWIMNADGSQAVLHRSNNLFLGTIAWSADGEYLLFDCDNDWDGWNELVMYKVSEVGGGLLYDPGQDFVDAWAGSFSPDGQWVIFTRVEYELYGDELLIKAAYVEKLEIDGAHEHTRLTHTAADLNPYWETADKQYPSTRFEPLPHYSRAGGIDISWTGEDFGPAGLRDYELQYRYGSGGAWETWWMDPLTTQKMFTLGAPGDTYYFRVRGLDQAGNVEPWPVQPDYDIYTQLYTWQLTGKLTDNRGIPLPQALLEISPPAIDSPITDPSGKFQAWLKDTGAHTLGAALEGFGLLPPARLETNGDLAAALYLPPQEELLHNGGFEAGLDGWQVDKENLQAELGSPAHTGENGLLLGENCQAPCLSAETQPLYAPVAYDLAVDSANRAHIIYLSSTPESKPVLKYFWRELDGTHGETTVSESPETSGWGRKLDLAVGGADQLHLVWQDNQSIWFSEKQGGDGWTPQVVIASGSDPVIETGRSGTLHVVYALDDAIYYLQRSAQGQWGAPLRINSGEARYSPKLAIGPDGTVHFTWIEDLSARPGLSYRALLPDGTMSEPERLFVNQGYAYRLRSLAAGPNGELHLLWALDEQGRYTYRDPSGQWTGAAPLEKANGEAQLAVDSQGRLHMFGLDEGLGSNPVYYRYMTPAAGWSSPIQINDYSQAIRLAIGPDDSLFLMDPGRTEGSMILHITARSEEAGRVEASQSVQVPAGMHHPTLAFSYRALHTALTPGAQLSVNVTDALTTTRVFSATVDSAWKQAWIGLEAWAGESITLSFAVETSPGEPVVQFLIDDLTLGPWLTPIVTGVTPAGFSDSWEGQPVTVTGDNFLPGAAIRFEAYPLTNVQWIDAKTLQATLPAGLPPGRYDLWVDNPGKQRNGLLDAVTLGSWMYLPLVKK